MARTRKTGTDATQDAVSTAEVSAPESTSENSVAAEDQPAEGPADEPEPDQTEHGDSVADGAAQVAIDASRPSPKSSRRRGGFFPMVLGGAIAAGLGFGAAMIVLPPILTPPMPDVSALGDEMRSQNLRISELTAQLEAIKTDPAVADLAASQMALTTGFEEKLAATNDLLAAQIAKVAERADALDARLTLLEKRPVADGAASNTALEAFGREMAQLRSEIDKNRGATEAAQAQIIAAAEQAKAQIAAAEAEAARLRAEAEAVGQKATARAALSRLQAALESGGSLDEPLADLKSTGLAIPAQLAELAGGVPSLASLRASFPPAARKALAASLKETAGQGTWERVGAFLKSQSGARSLSPRAGDDPDAILSRAEAALVGKDLGAALSEIAQLPDAGQAQMSEWVALVQRRIAATDAIAAIAREMN